MKTNSQRASQEMNRQEVFKAAQELITTTSLEGWQMFAQSTDFARANLHG